MVVKVIKIKETPGELTENIISENLCIKKANVRHRQKAFPLENIYLYNLFYLAALKTLNTRGRVILAVSFLINITFLEALLF